MNDRQLAQTPSAIRTLCGCIARTLLATLAVACGSTTPDSTLAAFTESRHSLTAVTASLVADLDPRTSEASLVNARVVAHHPVSGVSIIQGRWARSNSDEYWIIPPGGPAVVLREPGGAPMRLDQPPFPVPAGFVLVATGIEAQLLRHDLSMVPAESRAGRRFSVIATEPERLLVMSDTQVAWTDGTHEDGPRVANGSNARWSVKPVWRIGDVVYYLHSAHPERLNGILMALRTDVDGNPVTVNPQAVTIDAVAPGLLVYTARRYDPLLRYVRYVWAGLGTTPLEVARPANDLGLAGSLAMTPGAAWLANGSSSLTRFTATGAAVLAMPPEVGTVARLASRSDGLVLWSSTGLWRYDPVGDAVQPLEVPTAVTSIVSIADRLFATRPCAAAGHCVDERQADGSWVRRFEARDVPAIAGDGGILPSAWFTRSPVVAGGPGGVYDIERTRTVPSDGNPAHLVATTDSLSFEAFDAAAVRGLYNLRPPASPVRVWATNARPGDHFVDSGVGVRGAAIYRSFNDDCAGDPCGRGLVAVVGSSVSMIDPGEVTIQGAVDADRVVYTSVHSGAVPDDRIFLYRITDGTVAGTRTILDFTSLWEAEQVSTTDCSDWAFVSGGRFFRYFGRELSCGFGEIDLTTGLLSSLGDSSTDGRTGSVGTGQVLWQGPSGRLARSILGSYVLDPVATGPAFPPVTLPTRTVWLGAGLWGVSATEPTATQLSTLPAISTSGLVGPVNGRAVYTCSNTSLCATDGTPAGTGPIDSSTSSSTIAGADFSRAVLVPQVDRVVFPCGPLSARGYLRFEPCVTDGTVAGTGLLADVAPGDTYSDPAGFAVVRDSLYFAATQDEGVGRELFKVNLLDFARTPGVSIACPPMLAVEATSAAGATWVPPELPLSGPIDPATTRRFTPPLDTPLPLGATPVFVHARDATGAEASCLIDVNVRDTTPPVVTCPAGLEVDAGDAPSAAVTYAASATDAVSTATVSLSPPSGSRLPVGTHTVRATAIDAAGNSSSCLFEVRVRDTVPPRLSCPSNPVVEATGPGGAAVTFAPTATDGAGPPVVASVPPSGSVFALGRTPVTVTARDAAGNEDACTFHVLVRDTTPPAMTCPVEVLLELDRPSGAPVAWTAVATDAVSTPALTYVPAQGSVRALGTHDARAFATDAAGNTSSCTTTVRVLDRVAPAVTCPPDAIVEAAGPAGAVHAFTVGATDLSGTAGVTADRPSGSLFPLGTTRVSAVARDGSGNTATCTFDVTVRDTTPPLLTCPADVDLDAGDAPDAASTAPATATDAVSPVTVVTDPPAGTRLPIGTSTARVTATDAAGNVARCTYPVVVRDTAAPRVTCPAPHIVEAQGPAGTAVTFEVEAVDGAGVPDLTLSHPSGATFPVGTTSVLAEARDASDNTSQCTFTVTVADTRPPTLDCPAELLVDAVAPEGSPLPAPPVTAADAVSEPVLAFDPLPGTTLAIGAHVLQVDARDAAGNRASCTIPVRVLDLSPPVLACPADVRAEADGPDGATVTFDDPTATDLTAVTLTVTPASGTRFALGVHAVVVTAADTSGNTSDCGFTVTVADTSPPSLACPADLDLDAAHGTPTVATFAFDAADAVSTPAVAASHASGAAFPLGRTTVTARAVDAAGNETECRFDVVVTDRRPPGLTCPERVRVEAQDPDGAIVTFDVDAHDHGEPVALTVSHPSGTRFPLGTTTVEAVATDRGNNTVRCEFPVEVGDSLPPSITCPAPITVEAEGPAGAAVPFVVEGDDALGVASLETVPAPGSVFPLGTTTVDAVARDASGNTSTCAFTVAVVDTTPPALACPASRTLEALSPEGAPLAVDADATDAVSLPVLRAEPAEGSSLATGTHTVRVEARDDAGNLASCTFDVTVVDTTPPALVCPLAVHVEAVSPAGATVDAQPWSADAVSDPVLERDPPVDADLPLGTTRVRWIARDAAGNTSTCTFDADVVDTTPPSIACPDDREVEAPSGEAVAVQWPEPVTADAAGPVETFTAYRPGASFAAGDHVLTYFARDPSGNRSACSFTVRVVDGPAAVSLVGGGCACGSFEPSSILLLAGVLLRRRRVR